MKGVFWVAVASGPLAVGLWWLAGLSPQIVETVYSRGLYPLLAGGWSRLTGVAGFALAPWIAFLLAGVGVSLFFFFPAVRALALLGAGLSVLLAWFVLGWGLNYQRLPWAASHGWTTQGGTVAELESLAGQLADRANDLRNPTWTSSGPDWHLKSWQTSVALAYQRRGADDPLLSGRWGPPKEFPWPEAMSWAGIAGIYIPFTAEPLVNAGPSDWQLPFTAAHEAAHLRGWAREDEANFLAFWVLRDDAHPRLAYSAWSSALLYVASALQASGPLGHEAWQRVSSQVSPLVKGDWQTSFAYWEAFQGPVRQAAEAVNDVYLKSQGQTDGVRSYGRMVDLLLSSRTAWETSP